MVDPWTSHHFLILSITCVSISCFLFLMLHASISSRCLNSHSTGSGWHLHFSSRESGQYLHSCPIINLNHMFLFPGSPIRVLKWASLCLLFLRSPTRASTWACLAFELPWALLPPDWPPAFFRGFLLYPWSTPGFLHLEHTLKMEFGTVVLFW